MLCGALTLLSYSELQLQDNQERNTIALLSFHFHTHVCVHVCMHFECVWAHICVAVHAHV